jgi:hypothetical protein
VICGCCCCCQGNGTPGHTASCKLCYPSHLCASFRCPGETAACNPPSQTQGCGHCSTTPPDNPPGCTPPSSNPFACKKGGQGNPPLPTSPPCCTY